LIFQIFLGTNPRDAHLASYTGRTTFGQACHGAKIISQPADERLVGDPQAPPGSEGPETPFRNVLREATHDVHQRLHLHDGFAAIQNGAIDMALYRLLLIRLYGFYIPFEAATDVGDERSRWLADDLRALGVDPDRPGAVALCPDIPCPRTPEARLGALYVVEGSALGGRGLARELAALLGPDAVGGRRFFIGRGGGTGEAWRGYLSQLEVHAADLAARPLIIDAALGTFAVFERWMAGWSHATHD
jgi:heme oxygenase